MSELQPVYTLRSECQDCYKCIRFCPVKSIRVQSGQAEVISGRCVACGKCVSVCPSQAKRIRFDLDKVLEMGARGEKFIISLAPSWRGAFEHSSEIMIAMLKRLGAYGVSETALGAQEVSIQTASLLKKNPPQMYISSACPVIVDYIRYYRPQFTQNITPLASPALTHAAMLKRIYGQDVKVVFLGPCIGKKNEADRHPDLLAAALTFNELRAWMAETEVPLDDLESQKFIPGPAHEGALYPLDGGMNETLHRCGVCPEVQLINVSSLTLFAEGLANYEVQKTDRPIFIEALACTGGCVSGPCMASMRSNFRRISDVLGSVTHRKNIPYAATVVLPLEYEPDGAEARAYSPADIQRALHKIGKFRPKDEMNCSGCGYHTCRELAQALLDGNAEPSMCVSYMRQLATRKVSAMLKSIPSALVMVDSDLNILEVNEAFVRMFGGSAQGMTRPEDFINDPLEIWLDFAHLFRRVIKTGGELHREHFFYQKRIYDLTIFCTEQYESAGALITDVTVAERGREQIARRAREVITKNIGTVQEIASLLGEHMVETEMLLSSIAEDYGAEAENPETGENEES